MSLLASRILSYKGLANPSDVMSEALLRCAPFLSLEGFPPFVEQLSPNDCLLLLLLLLLLLFFYLRVSVLLSYYANI